MYHKKEIQLVRKVQDMAEQLGTDEEDLLTMVLEACKIIEEERGSMDLDHFREMHAKLEAAGSLEKLRSTIDEKSGEVKNLEERKEVLKSKRDELIEKIEELRSEKAAVKENKQKQIQQLEKERDKLQEEIEDLNTKRRFRRVQVEELRKKIGREATGALRHSLAAKLREKAGFADEDALMIASVLDDETVGYLSIMPADNLKNLSPEELLDFGMGKMVMGEALA
jgi:uncharacterized coiled-coil DUF342 family protein